MNDQEREQDRRAVREGLPEFFALPIQDTVMLVRIVGKHNHRWAVSIFGEVTYHGGIKPHKDHRKICRQYFPGVIYPTNSEVKLYLAAKKAFA